MKSSLKKTLTAPIISLAILGAIFVGAGASVSQQAFAETHAVAPAAPSSKIANFELTLQKFKVGQTVVIYARDAATGKTVFEGTHKFTKLDDKVNGRRINFDLPVGKKLEFGVRDKSADQTIPGGFTTIKLKGDGTMWHGDGYNDQFPGMIWILNSPTVQLN